MGSSVKTFNTYSCSTTSLDLPEDDINFNEMDQPSTSTSTSTSSRSMNSVVSKSKSPPAYLTRSVAKSSGINIADWNQVSQSNSSPRSARQTPSSSREINEVPSTSRVPNSNLISRSLNDINRDCSRCSRNFDRNPGMDFVPCERNRIRTGYKVWKMLRIAFFICLIGGVYWSLTTILKSMQTELSQIKQQTSSPGSGGSSCCTPAPPVKTCDQKDDKIKLAIKAALEEYNADKTGKTDFALEASGGSIVDVVDTEPYDPKASTTIFGIPICQRTNGARALIQANVLPGECWAFKGSKGSVVIRLLGQVFIQGFSLEHIPKSISPAGEIDTAPKDFIVWGLTNGTPGEGKELGKFTYNAKGDTLQHFPVPFPDKSFGYVQFNVLSNHGNPTFTCVYRLRVHGTIDNDDD